tara:strand:- start:2319 stop:2432 length:114 start_codon:yes stop_codon:yes gene_type:complete
MDQEILTGIATVVILAIILFWTYSAGKNYDTKKNKIR